jgi:hypothetical protein
VAAVEKRKVSGVCGACARGWSHVRHVHLTHQRVSQHV